MSIVVLRDLVQAAISAEMDRLTETLVNGTVPTIESYRHITGRLAGLQKARDLLDDETRRLLGAGAGPEREKTNAGIYDP